MSETQWKQFVQLFAEKNPQLTKQQVLQQAKKPFMQLKKYFSQRGGAGNSIQQALKERAARFRAKNSAAAEQAAAEEQAAVAAAEEQERNLKRNTRPITNFIADLDRINSEINLLVETKARTKSLETERSNRIAARAYDTIMRLHTNINIIKSPYITESHLEEIRAKLSELISLLPHLRFMGDLETRLDEIGTMMQELSAAFGIGLSLELESMRPGGTVRHIDNSGREHFPAPAPAPAPAKPLISDRLRGGILAYLKYELQDTTPRTDAELIEYLKDLKKKYSTYGIKRKIMSNIGGIFHHEVEPELDILLA